MSDPATTPLRPLPHMPGLGEVPLTKREAGDTLATWLQRARTTRGITALALASACSISRPWLTQIESGASLPTPALTLRLAQGLGEDMAVAMKLLEAAKKEKALRAGGKKRGLDMSIAERLSHGRAQRMRILQILFTRLIRHVSRPSAGAIAREMGLQQRTVQKHLELLEGEGFVTTLDDGTTAFTRAVTVYGITLEGIDRAQSEGWKPPFHQTDPILYYVADLARRHEAATTGRGIAEARG